MRVQVTLFQPSLMISHTVLQYVNNRTWATAYSILVLVTLVLKHGVHSLQELLAESSDLARCSEYRLQGSHGDSGTRLTLIVLLL